MTIGSKPFSVTAFTRIRHSSGTGGRRDIGQIQIADGAVGIELNGAHGWSCYWGGGVTA